MSNIVTFSLSNKSHSVLNMVSSALIWSLWKLRNDLCFHRSGWRSMEMLLFRIAGVLLSWMVLCPPDKKDYLKDCIDKIKLAASKTLWLPYGIIQGAA